MDIFAVITLIGGLAFFLFGMTVLSEGLERMAGGKLEVALRKLTSNRLKGLALGAGVTAAIQSSSAVTVMLVGLVNSGIMDFGQTIGIIMGSNIGTTMTAWILTLVGVESDNAVMSMLKPDNFSLVFAFVGIVMIMGARKQKPKDIGSILVGFAILMYGMKLMSGAVKPLSSDPNFVSLFTAFQNPLLGVLAGLIVTAIIQSSSASVGILQALALTGVISYGAAIPIIMGQNIGTCVTALISSIGVSRNAKKVAVVHITFNLIGTAVCLAIYCISDAIFHFDFVNESIGVVGIAVIHTLFNVFTTIILLPFTKQLEKFANLVLPQKKLDPKDDIKHLDERLLATPAIAIGECEDFSYEMYGIAREALTKAFSLFYKYSEKEAAAVLDDEDKVDRYHDEIGSNLVVLSAKELSETDSAKASKTLLVIGDIERLGDHAVILRNSARRMREKSMDFSGVAKKELTILEQTVTSILDLTSEALAKNDPEIAKQVEPKNHAVLRMVEIIRKKHISRLQQGQCSAELGVMLSELLNNIARVSGHCLNICAAIIELSNGSLDVHKYRSQARSENWKTEESAIERLLKVDEPA
ncbi:MAG: Na/Pi cotransporter family protein [Limosilactobacillus mucosae]|nr:Na/Pi cotransporter family protein [Limosilactobacillus mucosae]